MRVFLIVLAGLLLSACAGVDISRYAQDKPTLSLPQFFNGTLDAWGAFQQRDGAVVKRFHVVMDCRWQGDTGTLDEHFTYADGSTQRRIWTLTKQQDGSWRGVADDVEGVAIGEVAGNALHWRYTLKLPVDGTVYHVQFDDWMWQLDDKTMLNRSAMSKFGFGLGEVSLFFRKRD